MRSRKTPREINPALFASQSESNSAQLTSALSPYGVPLAFDRPLAVQPASIDIECDWKRLGARAWRVLQTRRMGSIFPGTSPCEFERYTALLRRSSARFRDEVFVGLLHGSCQWFLVPRFVFTRHAYILGGSGSGKTTHALAQLLIQLSEPYVDSKDEPHAEPPLLIIDMKPNGDRYLRALAEGLARSRKQSLRFFSNDPDYDSLIFDPLHCMRGVKYPLKLLETLLKAFSMVYPEGYGSDFFTNEQRVQLMETLYQDRPTTMKELIAFIRHATRGKSGNSDARGLYSALAALEHAKHVRVDNGAIADDMLIDFERFFERREVMYVHLNSRSLSLLSRDIGKLILFSLLETASQREKESRKVQCFVAIDEFHRLAARNVVEMLEDARSSGVGFLLAHQTADSMKTRDTDLFGTIFENTSFKQFLTLENETVIRLLRLISGRIAERRMGGSNSSGIGSTRSQMFNRSTTRSTGSADTRTHSRTLSRNDESWSNGRSHAFNQSLAETEGSSNGTAIMQQTTSTTSWTEEMVSALTEEVITGVNDTDLLSLVHVKGTGSKCLTPTGGVPTLIQGLYPFSEPQARNMENSPWPLRPPPNPDWYYAAARPQLSVDALDAIASGRPQPTLPDESRARDADDLAPRPNVNEGDLRKLEARIKDLAHRLADEMVEQPTTLERLARMHRVTIEDVMNVACTNGMELTNSNDLIPPNKVKRLKRLLAERGRDRES